MGYGTEDVEVLLLDDDGKEVGVNCTGKSRSRAATCASATGESPSLRKVDLAPMRKSQTNASISPVTGTDAEDGCLDCLGRKDFQVKVRSLRVNTREVEAAIRDHSGVKETTVIAQEQPSGDTRLVTYFVPQTDPAPTVSDLRNFLKEKISDRMIPSAFVRLEALPLTATGKVDRRALPDPGKGRPELETIYVPPQSNLEEKLAKLWGNVLSLDRVGVNDNFFQLGGDSLLAVRLVASIEEGFGKQLIPAKVFQSPTISQLATILCQEETAGLSVLSDTGPAEWSQTTFLLDWCRFE